MHDADEKWLEQVPPWTRDGRKPTPEEREAWREARARKNIEDIGPILADLRANGLAIDDIEQHRWQDVDPGDAVLILIKWLHKLDNADIISAIAGVLAMPWARGLATADLIMTFRRLPDILETGAKWSVADSLANVADASVFDELVELIQDKRHGRAREMLVLGLARTKNERAVEVLIDLLQKDDLTLHAIVALRKLGGRAEAARTLIEGYIDHPNAAFRKEAGKAIRALDRAKNRKRGRASRNE